MPPLPSPLADVLSLAVPGLAKRERTRAQLIAAAIQVFSARGVAGASIQEIAAVAGMTTGTVYNHFRTKDEVVAEVASWLAETLCRRIAESQTPIKQGAERMAIGNRRYIWLAEQSPAWALLLLDVMVEVPALLVRIGGYVLADLRLGIKQKSFRISSEAAAMDLIAGTVMQAMRSVAQGQVPANHGSAVAQMVLRGLGMSSVEAAEVATRPLPAFAAMTGAAPTPKPRRKSERPKA